MRLYDKRGNLIPLCWLCWRCKYWFKFLDRPEYNSKLIFFSEGIKDSLTP